jgi:CO/xanthine dehydrogenase Mo-binding subunit
VRIATGKVEIGQGVVTALGQIAADELDVPLDASPMLSGDSDEGPDEMYTTSSLSIQMSGSSIRLVCAEVRAKALDRAALRLNCSPDDLTIVDGQFLQSGAATARITGASPARSTCHRTSAARRDPSRTPATRSSASRSRASTCRRK